MNKRLTKVSKYLSFILCHHPESIGLKPDAQRWVRVAELVAAANESGKSVTSEQIHEVIAQSEQKRFELSDDRESIRAIQA